jgi:hypothetical protein
MLRVIVPRALGREVQSDELTNRSSNYLTILVNDPGGTVIVTELHDVYVSVCRYCYRTVLSERSSM